METLIRNVLSIPSSIDGGSLPLYENLNPCESEYKGSTEWEIGTMGFDKGRTRLLIHSNLDSYLVT